MILDTCCGAEKIYHSNQTQLPNSEYVTIDIRRGDFSYKSKGSVAESRVIINPKVLADMRYIPFKDNVFDIIVCDPPHMDCGLTGFMAKAWGSWGQQETIDIMKMANVEFSRCLKPQGTLILKIMPNISDRFKKILTNFILFLPIQTIRANGCINPKEAKLAAIWYIGIHNKSA